MISLKHPVTGHEISVGDESADFWKAAGYRGIEKAAPKAPAKKAASKKSSSK